MTQQLRIADHNGCNLNPKQEAEWPAFDRNQEYCGQIWLTASWAVPEEIHEELGLPNHIDLYLTSVGQWAPTLEQAEHYLVNTEAPTEFQVKGASLGLFVPLGQWAIKNGTPGTYKNYRVFRQLEGHWDAEEIQPASQHLPPGVAETIFNETLSAMGGYALLKQTLEIRPCYLCRGVEGELIMHFDSCDRCNKVKIELCEVDLYTMTFYRFSIAPENRGCQVVATVEDIGREQLQHHFEEFTGLSLVPRRSSLPRHQR